MLNIGTYFDAVHGHHNERSVIRLALDHGWSDPQAQQAMAAPPEPEIWDDLLRDACKYLSTLVPKGYSFISSPEGDYGVYADDPVEFTTRRKNGSRLEVLSLPEAQKRLNELNVTWHESRPGIFTAEEPGQQYEVQGYDPRQATQT